MKKKKNNGNVLQITLILLFMLSLNIFSLCHLTILNSRGFQSIKQTNDIRLLKNILIANYKYENQNSILLSNYLELENYTISYTVDDMGDYTISRDQWRYLAWIRAYIEEHRVVFGIIQSRKFLMTPELYGIYHGRFVATLLSHFDLQIEKLEVTPLLLQNYDIAKEY